VALAVAALAASVSGAELRPQRRDADALKAKVAAITAFGERPSRQSRRTTVTETEVNAYLTYDARNELPVGVVEPTVTILGTGRVSGRAVVDLDAVRKERKPTSLLDPMAYLGGRLPITATGVLTTANGVGRFALESASVSGIPVPKIVLQEIVSYYSRTPQNPAGIGLDDPFALPARIREIHVERGQAIVVQ
jgi:hypothetical protein